MPFTEDQLRSIQENLAYLEKEGVSQKMVYDYLKQKFEKVLAPKPHIKPQPESDYPRKMVW